MATEDHDFDEINYFNLFGKKISWNRESGGAVGELSTEGLDELVEVLKNQFGATDHAQKLIKLFSESYTQHDNLAEATRYMANELFAQYGLVIVDGNDAALKKEFAPFVQKELVHNQSHTIIVKTSERIIEKGYKEQVHPREINLFYLKEGLRERIVKKDGIFYITGSELEFSEEQILEELEKYPERFSPNALLRPLYQEVILPNLCYVGGGGELAYWFQLKDYFESVSVPFPMLLLRNSVLLMPLKLDDKLQKLNENVSSLFLSQHDLEVKHTHYLTVIDIDFTKQRAYLKKQFEDLFELAKQTDKSFLGAVGAQEKKQLNGLDNLEKRLLKAQKRKLKDELERLTSIQDQLFPKESLQERTVNFSELYLEFGDLLLDEIKKELDPLVGKFTILKLS
jgi:bacillithiol biosynthesis cysteine-adding enzyme BshC